MDLTVRQKAVLLDIRRYTEKPTEAIDGYKHYWCPATVKSLIDMRLARRKFESVVLTKKGIEAVKAL